MGLQNVDRLVLPAAFRHNINSQKKIEVFKSFKALTIASLLFGKDITDGSINNSMKVKYLAPKRLLEIIANLKTIEQIGGDPSYDLNVLKTLLENEAPDLLHTVDITNMGLQEALLTSKEFLRYITLERSGRTDLSIEVAKGFAQFSVEAAIKKAREDRLDEGQFVGSLLGINPAVIRPGILFNYDKGYGKTGDHLFWIQEHNSASNRTEDGVNEMLRSQREEILDRYRVYSAGRTFSGDKIDDLPYLTHEIGHDIWFASLNNSQRIEFIEFLKASINAYKLRVGSNTSGLGNYDLTNYEATDILHDTDKSLVISEAFALALGNYVGYPIFSGRDHHKYLSDLRTMAILKGFFDKYNFCTNDKRQLSVDYVARTTPNFVKKIDLLGIMSAKKALKTVREEENPTFARASEQLGNAALIYTFLHDPLNLEVNITQALDNA